MRLQTPSASWDSGGCVISGKACLAFYDFVKKCPEAMMSAHKKCSGICIYAL